MNKVVDEVVDDGSVVDNLKRAGIGARIKAVRKHLGVSQKDFATTLGVSWRGIQENENHDRVPGGKILSGLTALGINTHWLLTEEGDMLLAGAGAGDQGAAVYNSESLQPGIAQGQGQYQLAPQPVFQKLDGALLRQCLGACAAVHGEQFTASNMFLQLEYAVDLYNRILRQIGNEAEASLEDYARLETTGLADQLRIWLRMGKVKTFAESPEKPGAPAAPR